jgi:hypothetical protein
MRPEGEIALPALLSVVSLSRTAALQRRVLSSLPTTPVSFLLSLEIRPLPQTGMVFRRQIAVTLSIRVPLAETFAAQFG